MCGRRPRNRAATPQLDNADRPARGVMLGAAGAEERRPILVRVRHRPEPQVSVVSQVQPPPWIGRRPDDRTSRRAPDRREVLLDRRHWSSWADR